MENLTDESFFAYALHSYSNPSCSGIDEFKEDVLRIKYIKRLIRRYHKTGSLRGRLLLNHIIGMSNVFRAEAVARLLFLRIEKKHWPALRTALEYLSLMPDVLVLINGQTIAHSKIPRDENLHNILVTEVESNNAK